MYQRATSHNVSASLSAAGITQAIHKEVKYHAAAGENRLCVSPNTVSGSFAPVRYSTHKGMMLLEHARNAMHYSEEKRFGNADRPDCPVVLCGCANRPGDRCDCLDRAEG